MGEILNCPSVNDFYPSIMNLADSAKIKGLVLYGAGFWGEVAVKIFQMFDLTPICFCDDIKKGQIKRIMTNRGMVEIPIVSLKHAARNHPEAIYIATVSNIGGEKSERYKLNSRLKAYGLLSGYSGFHPNRYTFLLDTGLNFSARDEKNAFSSEDISGIIVANHMGNSGSIFFNTLVDGHPNILNIVFLGGQTRLEILYEKRLQYLSGRELAIEISSQMQPYFTSSLGYNCFAKSEKIGEVYFLNSEGKPDREIYIDPKIFIEYLYCEIEDCCNITYGKLLKSVYVAYANTIGRRKCAGTKYYLYYDMHNMNCPISKLCRFFSRSEFDNIFYLYIIRNPIQQIYSFLKRCIIEAEPDVRRYMLRYEFASRFLSGIGRMLINTEGHTVNVRGIRFEDIKRNPVDMMHKFCLWLDVPYNSALEETTVNGHRSYFPGSSKNAEPITISAY